MDMVWLTVGAIDYQLGSTCNWIRDSLVLHMRPSQSLYTSLVSESIMLVTTWTSRCIPFRVQSLYLLHECVWLSLCWYVVYSLGYMFGISMSSKEPIYKLNKQKYLAGTRFRRAWTRDDMILAGHVHQVAWSFFSGQVLVHIPSSNPAFFYQADK